MNSNWASYVFLCDVINVLVLLMLGKRESRNSEKLWNKQTITNKIKSPTSAFNIWRYYCPKGGQV